MRPLEEAVPRDRGDRERERARGERAEPALRDEPLQEREGEDDERDADELYAQEPERSVRGPEDELEGPVDRDEVALAPPGERVVPREGALPHHPSEVREVPGPVAVSERRPRVDEGDERGQQRSPGARAAGHAQEAYIRQDFSSLLFCKGPVARLWFRLGSLEGAENVGGTSPRKPRGHG